MRTGYYDTPPQAPIRKSRSQGTSLGDEDRTSRGADSLISETRTHLTEDMPDDTKPELNTFSPDNFAYANINKAKRDITSSAALKKPNCTPPPSRKSKTAAQLTALKNQSINFFFTYPRRAIKKSLQKQSPTPVRPSRNYTSIGPSRPPRHNRVFREPVYEGEFIPLKDENNVSTKQGESKIEEIDCEIVDSILLETTTYDNAAEKSDQEGLKSEETRDLQSGDVIEKMKSRPLPPPPRPPRKTKDDSTDTADEGDNGDLMVSDDNQDGELAPDAYVNENIVVERLNILVATPQPDHEKKVDFGNHSILVDVLSDGNKKCSKPIDYLRKQEWLYEEKQVPDIELTSIHTVDKLPIKSERRKKSLTTPNKIQLPIHPVEITASTQTDALPDGCNVEEEEQTLDDYSKSEVTLAKESHPRREEIIEVEKKVETIVEHKVVVIPTPETEILKAKKLHVEELDVEKLSVNELQAKTITVSDIDGVSMQVTELSSKSGHLVISGFDLPSSFLEAITPPPPPPPVIQIQSSTQTPPQTNDSQTNTTPQEDVRYDVHSTTVQSQTSQSPIPTPANTPHKQPSPPPSIIIQSPQGQSSSVYIPTSPPPRSSIRPTSHGPETEEEFRILPRRRRQHSQRHQTRYSSDDDEVEPISYPIVRRSHHHESTATNLIKQLLTIWQNSVTRGVNSFVDSVNSVFPQGEKRKDAQTAACIVLVLIAGILLGFGSERTVHHHHWDFLPPHP